MSNTGQWINNVKQVIRVTLVGIDPGDQVQIKGYLRILLRVDFDIEWVSPKNPKVDLFIVNYAFSSSDSVKALVSGSESPVLYVTRDKEKSNTIEDNILYLKLEHVAILETWLGQNVPRIYQTYNSEMSSSTRTQINTAALESRNRAKNNSVSTDNVATNNNPEAVITTATNTTLQSHTTTNKSALLNGLNQNAITLINTFNNLNSDSYYEVLSNGTVLAVVQPKQRLVWVKGVSQFPEFTLNWQLSEVSNPGLAVKDAQNLNTWLWICVIENRAGKVQKILPLDAKLSLKTWPKPRNDANKSDFLRILAMTELMPLSVNDVVKKTNIAIEKVHHCMSALYMAGFMDTGLLTLDVYVKQQVKQALEAQPASIQQSQNNDVNLTTKDGRVLSSQNEIDQAVNKQIEEKLESNYLSKEKPAVTKEKGFGGILSRIRSTLGL